MKSAISTFNNVVIYDHGGVTDLFEFDKDRISLYPFFKDLSEDLKVHHVLNSDVQASLDNFLEEAFDSKERSSFGDLSSLKNVLAVIHKALEGDKEELWIDNIDDFIAMPLFGHFVTFVHGFLYHRPATLHVTVSELFW